MKVVMRVPNLWILLINERNNDFAESQLFHNMNNYMLKKIIILGIFLIFTHNVYCDDFDCPDSTFFYEKSSYFVKIPAYCGFYTMYPVGYIVGLPLSVADSKLNIIRMHNQSKWYSFGTFGATGYFILGTPFFALEKTFWDGPCYLYDSVFGDKDDGNVRKHQVPGQNNPPPPPQENDSEKR